MCNLAHSRTDGLNVTNLWDNVTPANNQVFAYSAANRLTSATGPYGDVTWTYDGVGNRTGETLVAGGITTADTLTYPGTSNRVETVVRGSSTIRTLSYDAAGNITTDARSGTTYGYTISWCPPSAVRPQPSRLGQSRRLV